MGKYMSMGVYELTTVNEKKNVPSASTAVGREDGASIL